MKFLFFLSFFLILYVYLGYPLLMFLAARTCRRKVGKKDIQPPVTVIITACNEEKDIAAKLENTLLLDYPEERLEIIVGSDGSVDGTNSIVRTFEQSGVKLIAFEKNRGKTLTQNDCVKEARNNLIVFMDAASICEKDALKKIAACFADARVGAVAGRIVYKTANESLVTESQGIYWQYEQALKRAESALGMLVGVDGPLYVVRKELYRDLPGEAVSDLMTPLLVREAGQWVVLEQDAICYEEPTKTTGEEQKTRRRVVARGFVGLFRYRSLLNPFKFPLLAWQIVSRKVLRWLVGLCFILMLISSFFLLDGLFYRAVFVCMILLLALAFIGLKNPEQTNPLIAVPYYFLLVNWSALLGFFDFLRGKKIVSWKPVRN